jgi:hypothetical protein
VSFSVPPIRWCYFVISDTIMIDECRYYEWNVDIRCLCFYFIYIGSLLLPVAFLNCCLDFIAKLSVAGFLVNRYQKGGKLYSKLEYTYFKNRPLEFCAAHGLLVHLLLINLFSHPDDNFGKSTKFSVSNSVGYLKPGNIMNEINYETKFRLHFRFPGFKCRHFDL